MLVEPHSVSPQVAGAIRQASHTTGTSFDYLLATAQIESNFNPAAQASTSSAQGLYQFIDQTWLATMKHAGAGLGFGPHANAIVRTADGRYEVPDPAARTAIMRLRSDPGAAAMMAGAYTRTNAMQLTDGLGRAPSEGELYIAHFLGSEGAAKLIGAALSAPRMRAADIFPQAAAANRPIFYERSGGARSVIDVYRVLTGRYENARAGMSDPVDTLAADATPIGGRLRGTLPATAAEVAQPLRPPANIPDTAGITTAYAEAGRDQAAAAQAKPLFQSMFSTPPQHGVAPVVSSLWTSPSSGEPAARPASMFTDVKANEGRKAPKGGV